MALSKQQKMALLAETSTTSAQVRRELTEYLSRSGLHVGDFARRVNYSKIAVQFFLAGKYHNIAGNDAAIRSAIVNFIASHPVAAAGETTGRLYDTENVRILRRYFQEALDRGRAYFVEGNPGTQKSYVLQHLVADLNRNELAKNGHGRRAYYIYCEETANTPTRIMRLVAEATGSLACSDTHRMLRNLRFDFLKRRVLLVFDEAQHLSVECFETLRALYDLPPHFGLLFAGSHQLKRMFTTRAVDLEQWNSRFHAGKTLPGIAKEEATTIVRTELPSLRAEQVDKIIKGSYATALGSSGERTYISARRLFEIIHDTAEKLGTQKAATA